MEQGKSVVSWQIDEYPRHERSVLWYVGATTIGLALLIYALVTLNFLFAFVIMMFGIIMLITATRTPGKITVAIKEDGIAVGRRFMPWKDLEKFWIIYEPPTVKSLYLDFKMMWRPHLAIPLGSNNPVAVRAALLKYLEEDLAKEDEPLSDYVGRLLKI